LPLLLSLAAAEEETEGHADKGARNHVDVHAR
jgi:hypothetical protein